MIRHRNGRTEGAHDCVQRSVAANNQPSDENIVACLHKRPRRDIAQLRIRSRFQIVNFDQRNSRSRVQPPNNGRVCSCLGHSDSR